MGTRDRRWFGDHQDSETTSKIEFRPLWPRAPFFILADADRAQSRAILGNRIQRKKREPCHYEMGSQS